MRELTSEEGCPGGPMGAEQHSARQKNHYKAGRESVQEIHSPALQILTHGRQWQNPTCKQTIKEPDDVASKVSFLSIVDKSGELLLFLYRMLKMKNN